MAVHSGSWEFLLRRHQHYDKHHHTVGLKWCENLKPTLPTMGLISQTMENVGEMVKLLLLDLWNQRLIKSLGYRAEI